jgi:hypothetical protein
LKIPDERDETSAEDGQSSGRESDPDGVAVILHAQDVAGNVDRAEFGASVGIEGGINDDSEKNVIISQNNYKHVLQFIV